MQRYTILWADDEIDLLKPHIIFLKDKGYDITPVQSGNDAVDEFKDNSYDIVFLDENMPGMTGLETLSQIKKMQANVPVVMITKSEEEHIMEEAIGSKIADYLIKPLNPNQILLSVKKILDNKKLVTEKVNMSYQQDFRSISMAFSEHLDAQEWAEVYKKLVYWDLEIENTENKSMKEVLDMQLVEANANFSKFINENYRDWLEGDEDAPLLSPQIMPEKVFPLLDDHESVYTIIIDNLRYDQWKIIEGEISRLFAVKEEVPYFSILPTTTAYARNAIFSGLMPLEITKKYPQYWVNDDEEGGKNNFEEQLLGEQLKRNNLDIKFSYHKISRNYQGKQLLENFNNLKHNKLNVIVFNFVDMLSHARTDMNMIKELAPDEAAYRSITMSWFQHSPLLEALKLIAEAGAPVVVTTDHGTVRVKRPFKIVGDRNVNTNLRYKQGKNLGFEEEDVMVIRDPEALHLPKRNVSTAFVFAQEDYFFAYPNNYNHYVNHYRDTFQHGGISLEEMIIPVVTLIPKQ